MLCSIPVRRLRVARDSAPERVAESITLDLLRYGAAEAAAAREGAAAALARAMLLARGALLKRGFEVGVLLGLERGPPGDRSVKRAAAAAAAAAGGGEAGAATAEAEEAAKGPLVVVARLVVTDLPPAVVILPDSFRRMARAAARARRELRDKSRVELVLPSARAPRLFEALAEVGAAAPAAGKDGADAAARTLLLLTPDAAAAGPGGPADRRRFFVAASRFQRVPAMALATASKYPRKEGLFLPCTVTARSDPEQLARAIARAVTSSALMRASTDGSAAAAAALARALVLAGDALRAEHGGMRLCALVDAVAEEGQQQQQDKEDVEQQQQQEEEGAAAAASSSSSSRSSSSDGGGGDGGDSSGGDAPQRVAVTALIAQHNPVFAALLQRPTEPVSVTVERADVAQVARTAAALNLVLARTNGAGSVMLIPTELDEAAGATAEAAAAAEAAAEEAEGSSGGGGGSGGGAAPVSSTGVGGALFSLRVQRVPPGGRLPRPAKEGAAAPRAVLRVRRETAAPRLAAAIVGGVMAGESRQLEVRDARALPAALQALSLARARLLERGAGVDLAAVPYLSRQPQRLRREQEEQQRQRAGGGEGADERQQVGRQARGAPALLGPPTFMLRLVTIEVAPPRGGGGGGGGGESGSERSGADSA